MSLQACFSLSWILFCLIPTPPHLDIPLSMARDFTFDQIVESLRLVKLSIVWVLEDSLSIQVSNSQKLEVQALNSSCSMKGA